MDSSNRINADTPAWVLISIHLEEIDRSKAWLAKKIGISRSHMHFILNGERPLTDDQRESINTALGTDY